MLLAYLLLKAVMLLLPSLLLLVACVTACACICAAASFVVGVGDVAFVPAVHGVLAVAGVLLVACISLLIERRVAAQGIFRKERPVPKELDDVLRDCGTCRRYCYPWRTSLLGLEFLSGLLP
jgi:hypothetical protein